MLLTISIISAALVAGSAALATDNQADDFDQLTVVEVAGGDDKITTALLFDSSSRVWTCSWISARAGLARDTALVQTATRSGEHK